MWVLAVPVMVFIWIYSRVGLNCQRFCGRHKYKELDDPDWLPVVEKDGHLYF